MADGMLGYFKEPGNSTIYHPISAVKQLDGSFALKVDTELEVDGATLNISNMKMGSVDQTKNALRFLKVEDDGTLSVVSNPLDLYSVADTDESGSPKYYGYVDINGRWYVLRVTQTGQDQTYRYFRGLSNYTTAWLSRVTHSYDYLHIIF